MGATANDMCCQAGAPMAASPAVIVVLMLPGKEQRRISVGRYKPTTATEPLATGQVPAVDAR